VKNYSGYKEELRYHASRGTGNMRTTMIPVVQNICCVFCGPTQSPFRRTCARLTVCTTGSNKKMEITTAAEEMKIAVTQSG
jgi:hypothetical protein